MLKIIQDLLKPFATHVSTHDQFKMRVLEFLTSVQHASISDIASEFGIFRRTVDRLIAGIKVEPLLICEGSARAGTWIIHNIPSDPKD